jgi:hypothetical protein
MAVAFFPRSSKYFPVWQPAVLNFQVGDLKVLGKLSAAGVSVDAKREEHDYGRFAWFTDRRGKQGRALAAARVNLLAGRRASV